MLSLALQMLRGHRAGFIAAFVAVFCGSTLITVCGVLIDSSQRGGIAPDRYATAPVVVTAPQEMSTPEEMPQRFTERVPLSLSHLKKIAGISGVQHAVGDVSVRAGLRTPRNAPSLNVHGWSSTRLTSGTLSEGRHPNNPSEIVLSGDLGVHVGDTVDLEVGDTASPYRVVGVSTAAKDQAFLTDKQARALSGNPNQVDAVAVQPDSEITEDELAERVGDALPDATVSVGDERADAEFLDVGEARSFLILIAGSFGGTVLLIVLLVVASTLGLAMQQRRREFALLRAIAATPRQIYRLLGTETALLSAVAALLGAAPGVGLSFLLRGTLVDLGVVPAGFHFVIGPLPILATVVCCVLSAVLASLLVARRAARASPVTAMGEAAVEPPRLGRVRIASGWLLIAFGVVAGGVLPLLVGGPAAAGSAASSALLLVIGMAMLGPWLLALSARTLGRLGMRRTASGWLSEVTARSNARRLGSATTPLIMGVALAAVQIFTLTTTTAAANQQADAGLVGDRVLVAENGIAPSVVDDVRHVPGMVATPVAHTQVLITYDEMGDPATEAYSTQGVTPSQLDKVMDLDVEKGDLSGLTGDTVALSRFTADTLGVDIGSTVTMRLGDGKKHTARLIAVYDRGHGFGDVTLPNNVVVKHTTSGLNDYVLTSGADGDALRTALESHPEVTVTDRDALASNDGENGQSAVNLLLNLAILAFIAIAVVNILVLATAARVREFALLRLLGAKPRQVRAMMRGEQAIVVAAAIVFGSLAALPPLIGISLSLTGSPLPTVPPMAYLGIAAVTVALGWCSLALPTRFALRTAPVAALSFSE